MILDATSHPSALTPLAAVLLARGIGI